MPVHDWTRVDANLFHDFHQTWTIAIRNALNGGLLPSGYSALVEQHACGVVTDVLTLERRSHSKPPAGGSRGAVLTAPPPAEWLRVESAAQASAALANRIVIRHSLGRVVCVMEIVSPGNKSSRHALRRFVEKTVELLNAGIHVLVIDLFPPTARDPQGIHRAIWDEIEEQPFAIPPDKPVTLASYVAGEVKTAYVRSLSFGDELPDMPAWLDEDSYVPVPLEATYRTTWDSCPADMRDVIERGGIPEDVGE
jgi:hypothetical protein